MKKYKIRVILEEVYDDIIAENEEQASLIASDFAIGGGCWMYEVEDVEEIEEEE